MVFEMALSTLAVTAVILFQAVVWIGTHQKRPEDSSRQFVDQSSLDSSASDSITSAKGSEASFEDRLVARLLTQTGSEMLNSCRSLESIVQDQLEED